MTDKQPSAAEVQTAPKEPRKRRNTLLWILGPALVLGIAGYVYVTSGRYVSTDNAYVQADHATIAPQISGRVVEVLVHDNQSVKAGDVLFRIDSQPLEIAMTRMQAQMETARGLLDAIGRLPEVRVVHVGDDQAQGVGAARAQRLGAGVGHIAQLGNSQQHAPTGLV